MTLGWSSGMTQDWKKKLSDADKKTVAVLAQVAEKNKQLGSVSQSGKEFEYQLSEVKGSVMRRLVRLNILFMNQPAKDKVPHDFIEQSKSVFHGFDSRAHSGQVNSFYIDLKKGNFDYIAWYPATLTDVPNVADTSVFWRSDSKVDIESVCVSMSGAVLSARHDVIGRW